MTAPLITIVNLAKLSGHSLRVIRYMFDNKIVVSRTQRIAGRCGPPARTVTKDTAVVLLCLIDLHRAMSPGFPMLRMARIALERHQLMYPLCHTLYWDVGPNVRLVIEVEPNRKKLNGAFP